MSLQELKREIALNKLTTMPLFLSDSNISSITTFLQNMKIFLKLFSKIRSRTQTAVSRIKKGNKCKDINPLDPYFSLAATSYQYQQLCKI